MFGRFSNAIDTLLALQNALDTAKTFDYFGSRSFSSRGGQPSVNFFKDGENLVLMAELPGLKKEEIKVEVKDDVVTLSGKRALDYPEESSVHRIERRSHAFNRSIKLPIKVDANQVRADYKNGILSIILPRAEKDMPKQITVS